MVAEEMDHILKEDATLNKQELVANVAEQASLTKKDAEKAVNAVFEAIKSALSEGDRIQLIGFGTFEVKDRKARKGRNPQSGEEIDIPASKTPVFKAGKALKDSVN
ncbi:DNA-binding protein HU [Centipeda periodontii DSM 2778]|uniref:DNA-binding protein HU n=1 Tax=Centipeda periodontii DSM 2778 TaxID=888060 RepID=F5RPD5_9FIRM|nr:DNA-binding protein HU [Centipeda periodontii DSM 2778]